MNLTQLLKLRFEAQGLYQNYFQDPVETVKWMGGIQAQNFPMAEWALGIRTRGTNCLTISHALDTGALLRTHVLRPTWHIVAAEDLPWMIKLTATQVRQSMFTRDKALGIQPKEYLKADKILEKILSENKPLTRQQLIQAISKHSIPLDEYRANHFLIHAETEGLICSGPNAGSKNTYALVENRLGKAAKASAGLLKMTREEALAALATRYFQSRGPATLQDFTWWSGLKISDARKALNSIEDQLTFIEMAGQHFWYGSDETIPEPGVKADAGIYFLPAFDEYLISYKERSAAIELIHQPQAFTKNGLFQPVVVYGHKVIGTWSLKAAKHSAVIQVLPFETLPKNFEQLSLKGQKNYAAFLDRPQASMSITVL